MFKSIAKSTRCGGEARLKIAERRRRSTDGARPAFLHIVRAMNFDWKIAIPWVAQSCDCCDRRLAVCRQAGAGQSRAFPEEAARSGVRGQRDGRRCWPMSHRSEVAWRKSRGPASGLLYWGPLGTGRRSQSDREGAWSRLGNDRCLRRKCKRSRRNCRSRALQTTSMQLVARGAAICILDSWDVQLPACCRLREHRPPHAE